MYVIYEKDYIDRLGKKIDNQVNIGDSNSVNGIVQILKNKRKLDITTRCIYKAIKTKVPISNKYYIYKIKE